MTSVRLLRLWSVAIHPSPTSYRPTCFNAQRVQCYTAKQPMATRHVRAVDSSISRSWSADMQQSADRDGGLSVSIQRGDQLVYVGNRHFLRSINVICIVNLPRCGLLTTETVRAACPPTEAIHDGSSTWNGMRPLSAGPMMITRPYKGSSWLATGCTM